MTIRELQQVIPAVRTSDGAGVTLYRSLGRQQNLRLDPFLMLDEFGSDQPQEYLGGFPSHPHRGFETVTYMLAGHMLHEDHLGNHGHLHGGDVQWMTTGRGIIHSEMPQQQDGLMRGFQLWINLPAATKMQAPAWCDIPAASLVRAQPAAGVNMVLIAGELTTAAGSWQGPVSRPDTRPLMADLHLDAGATLQFEVPVDCNALLYVYEGELATGASGRVVHSREAGVLGAGNRIQLAASSGPVRVLLLAAQPLGEPVVQWGPFVMNTAEEIEAAISAYRDGTLQTAEPV